MTKEEMHNLYNVTDIQQLCRMNDINAAGKKSALIKRILDFLDSGQQLHTTIKKRTWSWEEAHTLTYQSLVDDRYSK